MLNKGLEALADMKYPGHLLIIGKNSFGDIVAVYGIAELRKASRLASAADSSGRPVVYADALDQSEDRSLLFYDALTVSGETVIAGNGLHTRLIRDTMDAYRKITGNEMPLHTVLPTAFSGNPFARRDDGTIILTADYKPDAPVFTSRISCVARDNRAFMCIARKGDDKLLRAYFELALESNIGHMIAEYDGPIDTNSDVIPAFQGCPKHIRFLYDGPSDIANVVYRSLGEFAVGAACLVQNGALYNAEVINITR